MRKIIIIIMIIFLSACAAAKPQTCVEQSADFLSAIDKISAEWDDANVLANQTPKIALSPQVAQLQAIKREADALKPPDCASNIQAFLSEYMDNTINGYLKFMSDSPAMEKLYFDTASTAFDNFTAEYQKVTAP